MTVKLLTDHHLEFLSLKGGCTGWSESSKCLIVGNHMSRLNYDDGIFYSKDESSKSLVVFNSPC